MLELFSAETTIVVALDLGDEENNLIQTAVSLAKKTGSRLIFVHATQPFRGYISAGGDMVLPYEAFEHDIYTSDVKSAEQKLLAIRDRLPPELVIDLRVVRDFPENALESVAEDVGASLVLCGMSPRANHDRYGGMSTALSLMNSSKFPVMILPLDTAIDFASKDHNILVADNLRDEGLYALRAALGLCKSISYSHLFHLHVKRSSYREINETVDKIKTAMVEGRLPFDPDLKTDVYLKHLKDEMRSAMVERLEAADSDFARGLHWTPRICFGQPAEELQQQVRDTKADILIFGKHHFLRPKGLVLGKIPYQAMMENHVASIVVPDMAMVQ